MIGDSTYFVSSGGVNKSILASSGQLNKPAKAFNISRR